MQRGSFFVKEHILANMSFLSYAHVSRCARHALEPTDHRLLYADDIMICAVSPHSVVAIRNAWCNAPWFFLWGQQQQWIGRGGPLARPCCCDDIKHAMKHRADCLNTYCKYMPFSIKYVYNCLYSILTLTGEHIHLRITHKRHVCEYMFLHKKNDLLCMAYHPSHFVGEVLLHPIYILFMKSATSKWNGPNDSKLGRCVDQCITNNWLHFQTDGVHIGPPVTSNVSVMPCSVSADLPNKVETWKLVQVCLVDAISASECIKTGQNGWFPGSRSVIHDMLLWQLCTYRTSGEKRVLHRDEQVLDHVMWPTA